MTWLLTVLSILGVVLNIRYDRRGFVFWMVSNLGWAVTDFYHGLYAQSFCLSCILFCHCGDGWHGKNKHFKT
jgi:hypothetical protein